MSEKTFLLVLSVHLIAANVSPHYRRLACAVSVIRSRVLTNDQVSGTSGDAVSDKSYSSICAHIDICPVTSSRVSKSDFAERLVVQQPTKNSVQLVPPQPLAPSTHHMQVDLFTPIHSHVRANFATTALYGSRANPHQALQLLIVQACSIRAI